MNAASSVSVGKNHFWGVEYNKMSFSNRLKKYNISGRKT